jgi:hypothetical protein
MTLQRLIITFKADETVLHTLHRTQDGPGSNTKARRRGGGYGARQDRPYASPRGLIGTSRCCRDVGVHHQGGCSFGHNLTSSTTDSKTSEGREPHEEGVSPQMSRCSETSFASGPGGGG